MNYTVKVVKPDHRYEYIPVTASSPALAAFTTKSAGTPALVIRDNHVVWTNQNPEDRKFLEAAR